MTGDSAATTTTTCLYTVLYYKRKNKVHKSKGVSKLDGTLNVVASSVSSTTPISVTLTSTDTGAVVYRGGMRGCGNTTVFNVDETISVGAFEVEILSCETANANSNTSLDINANPSSIMSGNRNNAIGNRGNANAQSCRRFGKKSLGLGSSSSSNQSRRGLGGIRPLVGTTRKTNAQHPVVARKRTKPSLIDSENLENLKKNDSSSPVGASSSSASPLPVVSLGKPKRILPGFKRPILGTKRETVLPSMRRTKLVSSSSSSSKSERSNLSSTAKNGDENYFPGAIGTLSVPHSIRKVLRPHQIEGVVFLWNCLTGNGQASNLSPHIDVPSNCAPPKGCILSDEMGLGKTLMTIATIASLHRQNRTNRFVVVCPSSLVSNWAREFDKWLGKVGLPKRVVVKKGGEEGLQKIKAFGAIKPSKISEVLIVSYDLFRMKAATLKNVQRVALLVVDEGHRLKNTSGSLTMTALESLPCNARLCITATPIQNNLGDMYTIVNFVCPGVLGDIATFRREYERPITRISSKRNTCTAEHIRMGEESRRRLDRIIQSLMLRRLQKDILNNLLPPRHVFLLFCRPTLRQRKLYKNVSKFHDSQGLAGTGESSQEALAALMGLRKICTHPKLLECPHSISDNGGAEPDTIDCEGSGKLMVLRDIILEMREKEPTDKVVIISNFTSTLSIVEDAILRKLKLNFLRLDGSISSVNRQSLVDTFNRTSANVNFALTLSSKAGGVGLNLIGANRLIMVDPDWNPSTDMQAMARIYREGQKKECFIYRCFTTGTLEEIILQRQIQKGSLATMTMDRAQKSSKTNEKLNANELRDCFTLKDERCVCDTKQKVRDWPDYEGKASLASQGCQDTVLMAVAGKEDIKNSNISFVHIVKGDDATGSECAKTGNELDCGGDEESEIDEDDDCGINDERKYCESGSSDDEFEFE